MARILIHVVDLIHVVEAAFRLATRPTPVVDGHFSLFQFRFESSCPKKNILLWKT
jgi:hypothetical protein